MKRAFLLCAAVLMLGAISFAADTVIAEIVARVNSSIITRSELQRTREQVANEIRQQNPPDAQQRLAEADKNALRDLIDQQLLIQRASDLGLSADTELIKDLDAMRKDMKLDTLEDLEKAAVAQGISWEDFKQQRKNQILTSMVIGREVQSRIQIPPEEIKAWYEEHKQELDKPERVRLTEIMLLTSKKDAEGKDVPMTEEEIAKVEKKANEAAAEIKAGMKFEQVLQKYSDGPSVQYGGDLGYFERGQLAKDYEDKVFAMKNGEVTDVIRTKQGFMILRVQQHLPAGIPPIKDVQQQIEEVIYRQKMAPQLRQYLTRLREEAYIDIKAGFVDAGASPNQTKPVITAANDSQDKSKEKENGKKKKKFGIF